MKTNIKLFLIGLVISLAQLSCSNEDISIMSDTKVYSKTPTNQQIALTAIYNANPDNTLNWNLSDPDISNWQGVTTNNYGDVVHLNLSNKNLEVLPPEISDLYRIRTLYLNGNKFDQIASQIGEISYLERLYLYNNDLSDLPSQMENLTKLTDLYIGFNEFTKIPDVVGKIKSLEVLNASHNEINSILGAIYKMPNLKILGLFNNNISYVSSYIRYLKPTLLELNLGRNNLNSIPKEIGNLSYLKKLYLHQNDLISVPYELGNLSDINFIDLRNNGNLNSIPAPVCDLNTSRYTIVYIDNWALCF